MIEKIGEEPENALTSLGEQIFYIVKRNIISKYRSKAEKIFEDIMEPLLKIEVDEETGQIQKSELIGLGTYKQDKETRILLINLMDAVRLLKSGMR